MRDSNRGRVGHCNTGEISTTLEMQRLESQVRYLQSISRPSPSRKQTNKALIAQYFSNPTVPGRGRIPNEYWLRRQL